MAVQTGFPGYIEDLTGEKWVIRGEKPMANGLIEYLLRSEAGTGDVFVSAPDIYKMHSVDFWDAVDSKNPIDKLEALVDSQNATAITEVFPRDAPHPRYKGALEAHGTNGWTPLFRAVMLGRGGATIGALVVAGAKIYTEQSWRAFPQARWTPMSVALARADEESLAALLLNDETPPDVVAGALTAAFILDVERKHDPANRLRSIIEKSEAYRSAKPGKSVEGLKEAAITGSNPLSSRFLEPSGGSDLLSGWTPLVYALIKRDLEIFASEVARASTEDLQYSELVLRCLIDGAPTLWQDMAATLLKEQRNRSGNPPSHGQTI